MMIDHAIEKHLVEEKQESFRSRQCKPEILAGCFFLKPRAKPVPFPGTGASFRSGIPGAAGVVERAALIESTRGL